LHTSTWVLIVTNYLITLIENIIGN